MALVVGRLVAQLGLDDSGYQAGMRSARNDLQQLDRQATTTSQNTRRTVTTTNNDVRSSYDRLTAAQSNTEGSTNRLAEAAGRAADATSGLTDSAGEAGDETNVLKDRVDSARDALEKIGIGFSMAGIVAGMQQAVMAASDLAESTNKVDVLFGDASGRIKDWASGAADSFALTNVEARDGAAMMALYGKQAGMSSDNLANFSIQMTELASDMASFSNTSPQEAVEALGAAFRGESDPIEQFGVLLNEDVLKTEALKLGLISNTTEALEPAVRVQAVYNAVLEQTTSAQGDMARTHDGFSNKLKILRANAINASAAFGEKLMPIASSLVDLLSGPGMSAVTGIGSAIGGLATVVTGLVSAFGSLPGPIQLAIGAIVGLRIAKKLLGDQISALGTKFGNMTVWTRTLATTADHGRIQMGLFGSSIGRLGTHIPTIARMQTAFINTALAADRMPRTAGAFNAAMVGMKGAASGLMGALGGPWGLAITGAMVGLGLWMNNQRKAQQAVAEHKQQVDSLSQSINKNTGELTKQGVEQVSKALADDGTLKLIEANKNLGISTRDYVDAATGQAKALDTVNAALDKQVKSSVASSDYWKTNAEDYKKAGVSLDELTRAVRGNEDAQKSVQDKLRTAGWDNYKSAVGRARNSLDDNGEAALKAGNKLGQMNDSVDQAKDKARQLAESTGDLSVSFNNQQVATGVMSKAMTEFQESTDGASDKVSGLVKALKGLSDDTLTEEEALQQWSDSLRTFTKDLADTGKAAIDASGHIDVTTEAGSKLQDAVVSQRDAYIQSAAAAYEFSLSQGNTVAGALDYTRGKLVSQRKAFIDSAVAAGYSADEAKRLADAYGLVPEQVLSRINVEGTKNALDELKSIGIAASNIPDGKVRVVDDTAQARKALEDLKVKYKVIDGKLVITDNSPEVIGKLNELGIKTTNLPAGYVKIDDNSPETIKRLNDVGVKTTTLPDGTVVIKADDAAFWESIRKATLPAEKIIKIRQQYGDDYGTYGKGQGVLKPNYNPQNYKADGTPKADGGITAYADGGMRMPTQAIIERGRGNGLVRWAEAETGWEAYIPGAPSKRARSTLILAETARRFGYLLVPNSVTAFADGAITDNGYGLDPGTNISSGGKGFPDWVYQLGDEHGVKPSTYAGHQESNRNETGYAANPKGLNRGIDWSGSVDQMQAFAEYLVGIAPSTPQLEQVIWQNPNTGQKIGWHGGQPDTDGSYFANDYSGHTDHVHMRASGPIGGAGTGTDLGGQQIQDITLTNDSSRDDVARKIIAEGRKRGYTDEEIQAVLSTAIQESNLDPDASGGGGAWHGIFQQDSGYEGRDDPNTNITGFYDRLDEKKKADPNADIWKDIFWLQQAPGATSAESAYSGGRQAYLSEIQSKSDPANEMIKRLGPGVGTNTGDGLGGTTTGSGTPVYVTNWPSGSTSYTGGTSTTTGGKNTNNGNSQTPSNQLTLKSKYYGGPSITIGDAPNYYDDNKSNGNGDGSSKSPKASTVTAAQNAVDNAKRDLGEKQRAVTIAEQKLSEVKANPKAKPSQITTAEENVTKARNDVTDATAKVTQAEQRLAELRNQGTNTGGKKNSGIKLKFGVGGTIPGHGNTDSVPLLGMPGEEIIRKSVAEKPGVRTFLKALNAGQVRGFAGGGTVGFGGYSEDTRDSMKPSNWYDLLAMGVGAGFAVDSLVEPYIGMVTGNSYDLGSMAPTVDTANNTSSTVSSFVQEIGGQISDQLAAIIKAIKEGKNINVKIESDQGNSAARMVAIQGGQ